MYCFSLSAQPIKRAYRTGKIPDADNKTLSLSLSMSVSICFLLNSSLRVQSDISRSILCRRRGNRLSLKRRTTEIKRANERQIERERDR